MQNKLQELTDKLYQEGLSKGKQEAEEILAKAKQEAITIVSNAKEEAKNILKQANKESEELKSKAEGDIKMASVQTLASVKQKLEGAITLKTVTTPVSNALKESEFMQSIITTIVQSYANDGNKSLELILPESQKEALNSFVENKLREFCSSGVNITYSKDILNGFCISQKGDGYYISFTDDAFEKIIAEYIRPKTRKLLFGE